MRQAHIDFRVFRIDDMQTGTSTTCTLNELRAANADDEELCIDCECLARGWGFVIGGGAAPAFEIYRIA